MHSLGKLEVVLEGTVEVHFSMVLTFLFFYLCICFFCWLKTETLLSGWPLLLRKATMGLLRAYKHRHSYTRPAFDISQSACTGIHTSHSHKHFFCYFFYLFIFFCFVVFVCLFVFGFVFGIVLFVIWYLLTPPCMAQGWTVPLYELSRRAVAVSSHLVIFSMN